MVDHDSSPSVSGPQIIFDALPVSTAKSFLLLIVTYSICLGMVILETFKNLLFDYRLCCKPGWTQPPKLISRAAYLLCRILSVINLTLVLVYLTFPLDNCKAIPTLFNITGMLLFNAVTLIFVQRTMALYAWKSNIVLPLSVFYLIVLAASAVSVPNYGIGERIPNSRFCAYDTRRRLPRVLIANIVYKTLSMIQDLVLFVLTFHRLVNGGIKRFWLTESNRLTFQGKPSASNLAHFLLRQGFHFYVCQTCVEIVFICMYFTTDQVSYQVLGSALLFSIPPIAAGSAFREMGRKASNVHARQEVTKVNEIVNSSNTPSGDHHPPSQGGPTSRDRTNRITSMQRMTKEVSTVHDLPPSRSIAEDEEDDEIKGQGQGQNQDDRFGLGISSSELSRSHIDHDQVTRISWAGQRGEKNRIGSSPHPSTASGVMVTVGAVSRTDQPDQRWQQGDSSPRYSSDNNDPDVIEMQRQWPRLSTATANLQPLEGQRMSRHDSESNHFDGTTITHYDNDEKWVLFSESSDVEKPMTSRIPDSIDSHSNRINRDNNCLSSASWIPQTPESPYPHSPSHTTLSNRFDSHPSTMASASATARISDSPFPIPFPSESSQTDNHPSLSA